MLLQRILFLDSCREEGVRFTLDDLTTEELRGLEILRAERSAFERENTPHA